jgi:excisionase family DNA binding protein
VNFELPIPPELVEAIAQRAALLMRQLELEENPPSPYMTVDEAAEFLRCAPKRIYDLRADGRLSRVSEGSRALVVREELERLVVVETDVATRPRAA